MSDAHPRSDPHRKSDPIVIIGAGMAGLSCALHLQERGLEVVVLEGDERVGGRVQTDRVDGFLLDRGFQVLLTAYPEVQAMLDLDALELGSFAPGAAVFDGTAFATLTDPFRRPGDLLRTLFSGVATPLDGLRIARLRSRIRRGEPDALLRADSRPIHEALRELGFSERVIERFFRPFLGGVLLDRDLAASSRAFEYFFRMFSTGDAALPARGMGAIPEQLASRLAPRTVRTRARVVEADSRGVALESGDRIAASAIVIATTGGEATKLAPGLAVPESNAAWCIYFDAGHAPVGDTLVLDGTGDGPVNELCVPSAVAPGYAPEGRSLVAASVLEGRTGDPETLELRTRRQLQRWFGPEVSAWRLLRIDHIPDALPSQPPGPFEPSARSPQLSERLFVCGDHRDLASLQGAMASGRRAATAVAEALA